MAEPGSWIKLDRSILRWEWYADPNTKAVFIHLLLKANTKDGQHRGKAVKRGQVATSVSTLAAEVGLTVNKVRTCLEHLKTTGEIKIRAYNRFSLVTIVNYDRYQETAKPDRQAKETDGKKERRRRKPTASPAEKKEKYLPQWWELKIPKELWGRFGTEDEYWEYAAREEGGNDA